MNLLGTGGPLASLIPVLHSLVGGYLLDGPSRADKVVQALGAGQRNIVAAMVVATMKFGNDVVVMMDACWLISLVVMALLSLELGKQANPAPADKTTNSA